MPASAALGVLQGRSLGSKGIMQRLNRQWITFGGKPWSCSRKIRGIGPNGGVKESGHPQIRTSIARPIERIRTASEIPVEVDLADEDAIPIYMKVSEKVLHLRRLGMAYAEIAERLGCNLWMAKKAARWGTAG